MTERSVLTAAGETRFWAGVAHAGRFFVGDADVQRALSKLSRLLDQARIPYAVIGGMALNEYGYRVWRAAQTDDAE